MVGGAGVGAGWAMATDEDIASTHIVPVSACRQAFDAALIIMSSPYLAEPSAFV